MKNQGICSGLRSMLMDYFQAENDLVTVPHPAMFTGLSENLALEIVKNYADGIDLKEKLLFLKETFVENIMAIVDCYNQME